MTALSVFLDEVGFFRYLASKMLGKAGSGQMKLFFMLYATVSVLTVFTSNDIVILTFTPFICYFSANAGIDPIPYLVTEFVAANSWSMALVIGNPTNIYLATAGGIGFLEYFLHMILPTLAAGLVSLLVLFLIFRKKLKKPITALPAATLRIADKGLLVLGLLHLGGCTVLVASASFFSLPMWLICLCFALSLFVTTGIYCLIRRRRPLELAHTFFRVPWQLAPFMLSMFVLILTLQRYGITDKVTDFLGMGGSVFLYGLAAYLACNIINNIPMSVFFSAVLLPLTGMANTGATYAVIAASNLGAIFTPVGALAGIMWMSILREKNVKFSFADFSKYGIAVSLPALLAALFTLQFTI
jgi:arsenical pump membrane protein